MKLSFKPYTLILKHPFTVASGSRLTTPVVYTEIEHKGITGYGEASMPPYLGESQESVMNFLSKVNLNKYNDPLEINIILSDIDKIDSGNNAAKAAIDIALHDLAGKILNQPCYQFLGIEPKEFPYSSFTIGIDTPEKIRKKIHEAGDFKILKIKLGRGDDKKIIETVCSETDKPFSVDINQGWKDKHFALDMIFWLKEKGAIYIEQPLPKELIDDMAWITERSPLPTIADEAVKCSPDIYKAKDVYHGINIKLMKSKGISEAHEMIKIGRALGMKILMGCMSESSCAVSAASHLSPLVDWADLDGACLIKNDPFEGMKIIDGRVSLNKKAGIGISKC